MGLLEQIGLEITFPSRALYLHNKDGIPVETGN